jgi:hypothetical protein
MEAQQGVFFLVVSPTSLPTCEKHSGVHEFWYSRQTFIIMPNIKFHANPKTGTCGRIYTTRLMGYFRNYANRPNNECYPLDPVRMGKALFGRKLIYLILLGWSRIPKRKKNETMHTLRYAQYPHPLLTLFKDIWPLQATLRSGTKCQPTTNKSPVL